MYVRKNFTLQGILRFTGGHIIAMTLWTSGVAALFEFAHFSWIKMPWLPVSVIGTAVAFYLGFKNNQSYDRLWEARKIWGAIVNSSRSWGIGVRGFVSNNFAVAPLREDQLQGVHRRLVYRHIAWLYVLRKQLLIPTQWEHEGQGGLMAFKTRRRKKRFGVGALGGDETETLLQQLLPPEEFEWVTNAKNGATQILDAQAQDLAELHRKGLIDDFRHVELQKHLDDFFTHQGKCERIKKFPLPRQYASMSSVFVGIFLFLMPFALIPELNKMSDYGPLVSVPIAVLVAWVYQVMELVGDYSENPFEGLGNDIPMMALCRTIEIDLRQMLREEDLPPAIQAKNNVLM